MLRYAIVLFAVLAVIALLSRNPRTRLALWVAAGLVILYAILKMTGVIQAIAPRRDGVF